MSDGLTDSLPKIDPGFYGQAYNNTDRMRVELPPAGDMAASGVVDINYPVRDNFQVTDTVTSASPTEIRAGASGYMMHITGLILSASANANIAIEDDAGVAVVEAVYLAANRSVSINFGTETPVIVPVHKALFCNSSTADPYSVTITGYDKE